MHQWLALLWFWPGILGDHGNQILSLRVDFNGPTLAEAVAMVLVPFATVLGKGGKTHVPHAVHLSEGRSKIPHFCVTLSRTGLSKRALTPGWFWSRKDDEIVLHYRFGFVV